MPIASFTANAVEPTDETCKLDRTIADSHVDPDGKKALRVYPGKILTPSIDPDVERTRTNSDRVSEKYDHHRLRRDEVFLLKSDSLTLRPESIEPAVVTKLRVDRSSPPNYSAYTFDSEHDSDANGDLDCTSSVRGTSERCLDDV